MKHLILLILLMAAMVIPVQAAPEEGVTDAILATDATDPADTASSQEAVLAVEELETDVSFLAVDGVLAGGYYFVCDCALGTDVKFYVPLEWSHDAFTLDRSGSLVNLSTSTCYAYAPEFPDYTIQCSRFGTFTYRASNYNTTDLMIRDISDTNIEFMHDESQRLSDSDTLLLIAAMVFVFGACGLLIRR